MRSTTKRASACSFSATQPTIGLPPPLGGPQALVLAVLIVGDDGVRGIEDVLGRTVVLLEEDHLGGGEVLLELDDVAHSRSAEGVDRLVGVADDGELGTGRPARAVTGECPDEGVLGGVRVLILVDEDVAEPATVRVGDLGEGPEEVDGLSDEVVEVIGVGQAQTLGVATEDVA